ncbi:flagellar motor switch protein FliN [Chromobacterium haemolyticum]|uniref:flagellar motor switch protein FliN n=1 Tax=Chromobacterium haemolyticum TaxID=394935 RepID=UPI0009D94F97|nr:flagellar motor switch protein FliN [Chromobacterium haemolyticum]OQS33884.1 flagellar motor switch protein FliN [Chromobacterium haemolyticum]
MNDTATENFDDILDDFDENLEEKEEKTNKRNPHDLLTRIPVHLSLEVGSTTVSLADLLALDEGSVLELNRLAGEPLLIKVNDTVVGTAEVVVIGESYGLKIVDLDNMGSVIP